MRNVIYDVFCFSSGGGFLRFHLHSWPVGCVVTIATVTETDIKKRMSGRTTGQIRTGIRTIKLQHSGTLQPEYRRVQPSVAHDQHQVNMIQPINIDETYDETYKVAFNPLFKEKKS